jgi:nucleoside-triphosphatase THEP1
MSLHLLMGARQAGKTTTCRQLAEAARARGFSVGGLLAPAVFADGACVGYDIVELATGRTRRLATLAGAGVEHVGPFAFSPEGLTLGRAALTAAAMAWPDLIIVDEVGPLELAGQGWAEYLAALAAGPGLTLFAVRLALADDVALRWNAAARHELTGDPAIVVETLLAELRA